MGEVVTDEMVEAALTAMFGEGFADVDAKTDMHWREKIHTGLQAALSSRPAGEAVAWLHDVVQSDGEQDQALSFSPDSFPLKGVGGFESIKSTPLFLAPQATHNKCDADFVSLQIARRFVPYLEPQRRAQLQVAIRDAICKATPPPAVSVPLCVCCGKPADGETACELHTGQWTCSSDCWDKAARMYDESPAVSEDVRELVLADRELDEAEAEGTGERYIAAVKRREDALAKFAHVQGEAASAATIS